MPVKEKQDAFDGLFDDEKESPSHEGSAWERIRRTGTGQQSTWDKIRRGENPPPRDASPGDLSSWDSDRPPQAETAFQDQAPSEPSFDSEPARTQSPKSSATVKRNKYGDIIELPDES